MSTSLRLDAIRASAIAALLAAEYPRLPLEAIPALPELQGLTRESIDRAIDVAVARGWIEQNQHGEVVATSPLDRKRAA